MTNGLWPDVARYIGPTPNENPGQMSTVLGVVLHIQQGTEAGTEAWQRNPASQVSSHFLAPKDGGLRQMVPVTDKAWCEVDGNRHWLSVECEGKSGETLTGPQVWAVATLFAKANKVYGVPFRVADNPNPSSIWGGGLGYHAMGGAAWGGHFDCPGVPIIAQRPLILTRALSLAGAPTQTGGTTVGNAQTEDIMNRTINGVRIADILGREESFNETEAGVLAVIQTGVSAVLDAIKAAPAPTLALSDAQVANLASAIVTRLPQTGPEDEATVRAALVDVLRSVQA